MSPRTVFELLPEFWTRVSMDSGFPNNSLYSLERDCILLSENPTHTVYPTSVMEPLTCIATQGFK